VKGDRAVMPRYRGLRKEARPCLEPRLPRGRAGSLMRTLQRLSIAGALALGATLLSPLGCGDEQRPEGIGPNLLLITLDTVRADFLEPYGYPERSSPQLEVFADEAVVFEQAFSTSPRTSPSHASILTSRHPSEHGVLFNGIDLPSEIGGSCVTLAEHLRRAGFFTGGIVSASAVGERYGFDRGFDTFEHERTRRKSQKPDAGGGADYVTETARTWLKKHRGRRFFLWVHYYEAHMPYNSEPRFCRELGLTDCRVVTFEKAVDGSLSLEEIRKAYRAEIFELDFHVGDLLHALTELGLDRDTVVAIVADHGEYLGEHQRFGHDLLYDEVLHVPMMVRAPGLPPSRRSELVSTIDLVPSLLPLLGVAPLPGARGGDVISGGGGRPQPAFVFAEWRNHLPFLGERAVRPRDVLMSTRSASSKLIADLVFPDRSAAYDLDSDPGETVDLLAAKAAVPHDLLRAFREHLESLPEGVDAVGSVTLDDETLAELEALGYL
jgi:choline-sulfatase